jgi:hypothetical protein
MKEIQVMKRQSFRAVKHVFVMFALALAVGSAAFAGAPGITRAEESCVATTFGTMVCTESFVVDIQTYTVEAAGVQSCQKGNGKSPQPAEQVITTLDTHEVTEYEIVTKTFVIGTLASVDYARDTVDALASSETISAGKCRRVKS